MAETVVVLGGVRERVVALLGERYQVHDLTAGNDRAATLTRAAAARAAVTGGGVGIDAATIALLPALELVVSFGVGYDKVDGAAMRARKIVLANTAGVTSGCVADHAIGMLLALERRIVAGDRFVREGEWMRRRYPLARRVFGRKLGILGLGGIGGEIARRGLGFGMAIGYHNRKPLPDSPHRYFGSLVELARWCDVLAVSCPGGAATRHIVDAGVLDALGPGGVLVNVARGSIVDEAALAASLAERRIAGAALDVFEAEPCHPADLTRLENVVLTPHIAGSTEETWTECEDLMLENLRRFYAGDPVLTPVAL